MMRVYIAAERAGGLCKIGCSRSPRRRVRALASLSGLDLDLVYVAPKSASGYQVEHAAHRILQDRAKVNGYSLPCDTEWFNVSVREARAAVREAAYLLGPSDTEILSADRRVRWRGAPIAEVADEFCLSVREFEVRVKKARRDMDREADASWLALQKPKRTKT